MNLTKLVLLSPGNFNALLIQITIVTEYRPLKLVYASSNLEYTLEESMGNASSETHSDNDEKGFSEVLKSFAYEKLFQCSPNIP